MMLRSHESENIVQCIDRRALIFVASYLSLIYIEATSGNWGAV